MPKAHKFTYWTPDDAPSDEWKYKTRGVILGKWNEIKLDLWEDHQDQCEQLAAFEREQCSLERES